MAPALRGLYGIMATRLRSRAWCFTINNYNELQLNKLKEIKYTYIIVGDEVGDSGTSHMQGYIYFANAITFESIKKQIPTAHIEQAKGNAKQNTEYCSKQKVLFVDGEMPVSGKRTDLEEVRELIKEGKGMKDIVEVATSYQSVKMAEVILKYHERKRDWKPMVYWFHGATGTGKSKTAYEMFPEAYTAMSTARWWDGYDAHADVIIDDMRKDFCKFHELLRYLDRFPVQIETKGGTRQFLARNIVITSCYCPQQLFDTREDVQQLIRRIDEIRHFE